MLEYLTPDSIDHFPRHPDLTGRMSAVMHGNNALDTGQIMHHTALRVCNFASIPLTNLRRRPKVEIGADINQRQTNAGTPGDNKLDGAVVVTMILVSSGMTPINTNIALKPDIFIAGGWRGSDYKIAVPPPPGSRYSDLCDRSVSDTLMSRAAPPVPQMSKGWHGMSGKTQNTLIVLIGLRFWDFLPAEVSSLHLHSVTLLSNGISWELWDMNSSEVFRLKVLSSIFCNFPSVDLYSLIKLACLCHTQRASLLHGTWNLFVD